MTPATRWLAAGTIVIVLFAAGFLAWVVVAREPTGLDPNNARLVARGKAVYAQHCAACHGANLEGQPNWRERLANGRLPAPPHDASGHTWHHSDKQLFDMVKNGAAAGTPGYDTDMPAYREILTDAEIRAVLSFIQNTWPADIRQRQQRLSRSGR
jgi:mono/diheme cytochrome c family protein